MVARLVATRNAPGHGPSRRDAFSPRAEGAGQPADRCDRRRATTSLPECRRGRTWDYRYSLDPRLGVRRRARWPARLRGRGRRLPTLHPALVRPGTPTICTSSMAWAASGACPRVELRVPARLARDRRRSASATAPAAQLQLDASASSSISHGAGTSAATRPTTISGVSSARSSSQPRGRWRLPDRGHLGVAPATPRHFVHRRSCAGSRSTAGCSWPRSAGATHRSRAGARRATSCAARSRRAATTASAARSCSAFGGYTLDASLLRLRARSASSTSDDPRMVRTADAIRDELGERRARAPLRRRRRAARSRGRASCRARSGWPSAWRDQGRLAEARERFDAPLRTRNDLGLFSEEYDVERARAAGQLATGLTHLSHILAALALERSGVRPLPRRVGHGGPHHRVARGHEHSQRVGLHARATEGVGRRPHLRLSGRRNQRHASAPSTRSATSSSSSRSATRSSRRSRPCAHAKLTGEVGVCMATSGPGAIHLLNGLYDAKLDHAPVVAIVGQQKRMSLGGDYQQEVDLRVALQGRRLRVRGRGHGPGAGAARGRPRDADRARPRAR